MSSLNSPLIVWRLGKHCCELFVLLGLFLSDAMHIVCNVLSLWYYSSIICVYRLSICKISFHFEKCCDLSYKRDMDKYSILKHSEELTFSINTKFQKSSKKKHYSVKDNLGKDLVINHDNNTKVFAFGVIHHHWVLEKQIVKYNTKLIIRLFPINILWCQT